MARISLAGLASGALLVAALAAPGLAAPAPSTAAASSRVADRPVVVHGVDFPSSLLEFRDSCSTVGATVPEPELTLRKGGARGTHALGWQYASTDSEAGALAFVERPTRLSTFGISVLAPGGSASGHVVGVYYDDSPGFTEGYWIGFGSFEHAGNGWIRWNAADATLSWSYIEPGSSQYNVSTASIRAFAASRGGDGGGGWAGAAFGCDGEQFFLDRLTVGSTDTRTYDFEGLTARAHMEWSTDGRTVQNRSRFTVQYGQKFWLLGHSDGVPEGGSYHGRGALMAKDHGRSRYRSLVVGEFTPTRYAGFRVKSPRRTVFFFDSRPTDFFEGDASERVTVDVRAVVRAQILDRTLVAGQRLTAAGVIKPGNRGVRVALERKVNGRWATLGRGRTRAGGEFRLTTLARSPGKWTVRVRVSDGKGNLGTTSATRVVTVKPRPTPQPPPPTDPTPEPDPIDTPVVPSAPPAPPDPDYLPSLPGWASLVSAAPECTMPGPHPWVPCRPAVG